MWRILGGTAGRVARLMMALGAIGLLTSAFGFSPAAAAATNRPPLPAGMHLVASGHFQPGKKTTTTARFKIPATLCEKLSASYPQLNGKPCEGTETVIIDATSLGAKNMRSSASPTMATANTGTVSVRYSYCGPLDIWCFTTNAQWSFNLYVDTWTNWVDCSSWYVLAGSGGVTWCGSTGNYTYTSTAGENFWVSQAGISFGGGQRIEMNADTSWREYNWS